MPIAAFLPPGYDSNTDRYPVLYMLHGLGGTNQEWRSYGLFEVAEKLMAKGAVRPFIIVLPQGDESYWVDHAGGGPQWGRYLARDVVSEIDSRYRTLPDPADRAVGGLSMGADGSLQIALNNPDVFRIVGAHSPVLRAYEIAPAYYGDRQYFEAHYPVELVRQKTDIARKLNIWLDVGLTDEWLTNVEAFHDELATLGIAHEWLIWRGSPTTPCSTATSPCGHNGNYWGEHAPEYLRFYGSSFGK